jgi:hypothetical protein
MKQTPRALGGRVTCVTRNSVLPSASAPSKLSRRGPTEPGPLFGDNNPALGEDTRGGRPSPPATRRGRPTLEQVANRRAQEGGKHPADPTRLRGGDQEIPRLSPNARTDKAEALLRGGEGRNNTTGRKVGNQRRADWDKGREEATPDSQGAVRNSRGEGPTPGEEREDDGATELIFKLERRGFGWGEEIFPSLSVEQRPLQTTAKRRDRDRSTGPRPWTVLPNAFVCSLGTSL